MKETIFKATNLSKRYKTGLALNGVEMQINRGDVYGFVGENGAGKTTLIRLMMGLSQRTSGAMELFGESNESELVKSRERMGCIVEGPALYPNMTAYENLKVHSIYLGIPDETRIQKVLELVKLADTGKKKAKNFSLGMKQRLGIAMALLNEPEFLVLDEPVNGLDPTSIIELRELLKRLNKEQNITILISSHILGELYQLATCYGFISKGKIVEQISLAELDEKCKKHICLRVDDAPKAVLILETKLNTTNYSVVANDTIKLYDFLDDTAKVAKELAKGGVIASEISIKGDDLESYYIALIGGNKNA